MDLGLTGKVALVTGAGRGIGACIATTLAREGCSVAIVDLATRSEAHDVARQVTESGSRALVLEADVSSVSDAERIVRSVISELGGLDILVCNAGITRDAVVWKMSEQAWDDVLAVNLKGLFSYGRAVASVFRERRSGRIVNVASINGLRGKFGQANYAAAKAGGIGLTKTLARELGKYGVTVNAVAPGMVLTDMAASVPEELIDQALGETVVGRLATPEDVAGVVAFLCSDMARHITGEVIRVDGGQAM